MSDIDQEVDAEASAIQPMAATGLRDAIKLVGCYLMAHGAATQGQITFWGGLVMVVGGVLWSNGVSWYKHYLLTRVRAIANAYQTAAVTAKQPNPGASK